MKKQWLKILSMALCAMLLVTSAGLAEGISNELMVDTVTPLLDKDGSVTALSIVTDPADTAARGDEVDVAVVVTTDAAASGHTISLTAPLALTGTTGATMSEDGKTATWSNLSLAAGETRLTAAMTIPANAAGGTVYTLTAQVDTDTPVTKNLTVSVPGADLVLVKAGDKTVAQAGESIVYTLLLDNSACADDWENLVVEDVLPEEFGTPVYTSEEIAFDAATHTLTWTHAALVHNETASVTYTVDVAGSVEIGDTLDNRATLKDITTGSGAAITDNWLVTVAAPDIALAKDVDDERPQPGQWLCFTLALYNEGTAAAKGAVLVDYLPDGMDIDETYLSGDAVYSAATRTVTWTLDVAAGAHAERDVWLMTPDDAEDGDTFLNTATATIPHDSASASCSVTVDAEPDLEIIKRVSNRTPKAGEDIKYTVYVKNTSDFDAEGVRVIDRLPQALIIDADSITRKGKYSAKYDRITWTINVAANSTKSVSFWATVPDDAEDGDKYVNKAYIPDVDSASVNVYVTDGSVPKTGEAGETVYPAPWRAGEGTASTLDKEYARDDADAPLNLLAVAKPEKDTSFAGAYAANGDLRGWLTAGSISEAVFQRDNEYYMTHDGLGNESVNGCVFMDENNALWPTDKNIVLYGHNMKSGAVFGNLDNFRRLDYLRNNPVVTFRTVYDAVPVNYVPFAVFDASMNRGSDGYVNIRRLGFASAEENADFVKQMQDASLFDIPVDVTADDSLLTLVTCSYSHDNGRFVVLARRVRDGESLTELTQRVASAAKK